MSLILMFITSPFTPLNVDGSEEHIIIREDGCVDPPDSPILINGSVYVLQSDLFLPLIIKKGAIIIDGNGFALYGHEIFQSKGITLNGVSNATVKNFRVEGFYYGVWIHNANCNIVAYNIFKANTGRAVLLSRSNNNVIIQNIIMENKGRGIMLENSNNNVIEGNRVVENGCDSIIIDHSNGNKIYGNLVAKNNGRGIWLGRAHNNTLTENIISKSAYSGIQLYYSNSNIIFKNTVSNNNVFGIRLLNSSLNHVYNNNFVNNTLPLDIDTSTNFWDNGPLLGGNYWSHLDAIEDLYHGVMQNETGSDGIIDKPYIINDGNVDNYPLVGWYLDFRVPNTNLSIGIVSNCEIQGICVNVNGTIVVCFSRENSQAISIFRVIIPHRLLGPPYVVKINDESVNYSLIFSNESLSIMYFCCAVELSEIYIIPEMPQLYILYLFLALLMLLVFRNGN